MRYKDDDGTKWKYGQDRGKIPRGIYGSVRNDITAVHNPD